MQGVPGKVLQSALSQVAKCPPVAITTDYHSARREALAILTWALSQKRQATEERPTIVAPKCVCSSCISVIVRAQMGTSVRTTFCTE